MCNGNTIKEKEEWEEKEYLGEKKGWDFPQIDVGHQTVDSGSSANIKQDK